MSHNASDAQKLLSVDSITATPPSNNPFAVTKGLTSSIPSGGGQRFFMLPDPTTVPAGMSYEIKDSAGTAGATATKIIVQAPGDVTIDSSIADDEITKNWGSKTYVSTGTGYVVRGDQRAVAAIASGGGVLLVDFGGLDGADVPTGWTSTTSGSAVPWSISTDVFHTSGGNLSSAGADYSDTDYPPSTDLPAIATLTYNAGTLVAGTVISFKWLRDTHNRGSSYPAGSYHMFFFHVNGLLEDTHNQLSTWISKSYTVPITSTYVFEWIYRRSNATYNSSTNNGCFIDEFEILDAPVPTVEVNFSGAEHDPLPSSWTSTRTGTAWDPGTSEWLIQSGIYPAGSPTTSSVGAHYSGSSPNYTAFDIAGTQTLTYDTTTLAAGTTISFNWMKDFYYNNFQAFRFKVNGSLIANCPGAGQGLAGSWSIYSYVIPSTGLYTLSWEWAPVNHAYARYSVAGYNDGCFIDEFKIFL